MGTYVEHLVAGDPAGTTRLQRVGGRYRSYLPDPLVDADLACDTETMELVADASAVVGRVDAALRQGPVGVTFLYAALTRSEGIASSAIEGHRASAKQVAVAEVSGEGTPDTLAVVRAMAALHAAMTDTSAELDDTFAHRVHHALLPRLHELRPGYRTVQNWVSGRSLLDARYVPPPPEQVGPLMQDLLAYAAAGAETALLRAAVVHAQFETIHPYEDGNGRVGRALTHTVLMRSGLTSGPVVPFSAALRTRQREYVDALTAFRHDGQAGRQAALSAWVTEFALACLAGAQVSSLLHRRASVVWDEWAGRLAHLRADSTARQAPAALFRQPAVTVGTLAEALGVSAVSAGAAVDQLVAAGILHPARSKVSRSALYAADDVLDLVTLAERQVASADLDTAVSAPLRHAPPLPPRVGREPCGQPMARSGRACALPVGHRGQHR